MILEAYAVHDAAVGAYNRPLFFRSRGEAVRSFQDAVGQPENGFVSHPQHYSFWLVARWSDENGLFEGVTPERVCGAADFIVDKV